MDDERDIQDLLNATKAFSRFPSDEIQRELIKAKSRRQLERELEVAGHRLREAVERQHRIVFRLRERGFNPDTTEALLGLLNDALAERRRHLASLLKGRSELS